VSPPMLDVAVVAEPKVGPEPLKRG